MLKLPFEGVRIGTMAIKNPISENKFISYEHDHHASLNVVPQFSINQCSCEIEFTWLQEVGCQKIHFQLRKGKPLLNSQFSTVSFDERTTQQFYLQLTFHGQSCEWIALELRCLGILIGKCQAFRLLGLRKFYTMQSLDEICQKYNFFPGI